MLRPLRPAVGAGLTLLVLGGCDDAPERTDSTRVGALVDVMHGLLTTAWGDLGPAERRHLEFVAGELTEAEYRFAVGERPKPPPRRPGPDGLVPGVWNRVALPGAVCADGSDYAMFVQPAEDPDVRATRNLVVYFEPGGACWDYDSCRGRGARSAQNLGGLPEDYLSLSAFLDPDRPGGSPNGVLTPLLWKGVATKIESEPVRTQTWSKVFFPYCTGDVFAGHRVAAYGDPAGIEPDLRIAHHGAENVRIALDVLRELFFRPQEMLVTGCSAGGAGALANYHFIRQTLDPAQSALLNDSGPIFSAPGRGNQYPLHRAIASAWGIDELVGRIEGDAPQFDITANLGLINDALAFLHPTDRLATALFERDYNYSIYSYARFYGLDEDRFFDEVEIRDRWRDDVRQMVDRYEAFPNLHTFVPYFRWLNDSHCTTLVNWTGTEIRGRDVDVGDFIEALLDPNAEVQSHYEGFFAPDFVDVDFATVFVDLALSL